MLPTPFIPATMSTQHPDNASEAYWCNKSYLSTTDEIEEAYRAFKELGCDEYMWDWEGKFVDEAVTDKLFRRYNTYFKKHQLGRDKLLTYRIPNIWEERGYRLARAFINILTSSDLAGELKLHTPPIFEVILPMTKSAQQIQDTELMFRKVARLKHEVFDQGTKNTFDHINVIPLVERIEDLTDIHTIIEPYLASYKKQYKKYPTYLRPFIARSDPALNAGLIPAVLSSKAALSRLHILEKQSGVSMYPIIGTGSLPFRGSVNPENIHEAIKEYSGIRTITIQSAFKYDYPLESVKKALAFIKKTLPTLKVQSIPEAEIHDIRLCNNSFEKKYRKTVEKLAPLINDLSRFIPARRERMLHIGLFGYSRGMGKVQLPRAITFTAVLYSLGVPPEFIGTGRGLLEAQQKGLLPLIEKVYVNMRRDLRHAGKYLNKENLSMLAKKHTAFQEIMEDVAAIEHVIGMELGPHKNHHFLHRNLVSNIYYKLQIGTSPEADIVEAARLRKSLG